MSCFVDLEKFNLYLPCFFHGKLFLTSISMSISTLTSTFNLQNSYTLTHTHTVLQNLVILFKTTLHSLYFLVETHIHSRHTVPIKYPHELAAHLLPSLVIPPSYCSSISPVITATKTDDNKAKLLCVLSSSLPLYYCQFSSD